LHGAGVFDFSQRAGGGFAHIFIPNVQLFLS